MAKGLENLIERNKAAILKKWFDLAVQVYAPDTAKFLKTRKDHFANPVGSNTLKGLEGLLDQLLTGLDRTTINAYLDPIIRIRAAQAFTPSQAIGFIFSLKSLLRDILDKELQDDTIGEALKQIDFDIDQMGLIAFDLYMECREKILQIGANETRNRIFSAFARAGLISDTAESPPKIKKTMDSL